MALHPAKQHVEDERVTAIQWFEASDWPELRHEMDDASALPHEHIVWQSRAQTQINRLESEGFVVHKVRIQPGQFRRWCVTHGMRTNAGARALFVSEELSKLMEMARDS